jgi:hypothetical protein
MEFSLAFCRYPFLEAGETLRLSDFMGIIPLRSELVYEGRQKREQHVPEKLRYKIHYTFLEFTF